MVLYVALGWKVFEVLQHRAGRGRLASGLLEPLQLAGRVLT